MGAPELGGLGLSTVGEGLLNVVGGVELGGLHLRRGRRRLGLVAGEGAAVLGLDGPDPALVVHLRPRELADPADEIGVAAPNPSLLRRHCSPSRARGNLGNVAEAGERGRRRGRERS